MESMDTQIFWNVIGEYNAQTMIIQMGLFIFLISAIVVSYMQKINWLAKFALGITNVFISFGFFALYGTEPIQKYFALPLYLICGVLFLYESWHSRNDVLQKPNILQAVLLALYLLYPFVFLQFVLVISLNVSFNNAFLIYLCHLLLCCF